MVNHVDGTYPSQLTNSFELLSVLADPIRQQIIALFYRQPEIGVTAIACNFSLSRPTISHHLNLMRRAGVLASRKDGKEMIYSFNKSYVVNELRSLLVMVESCC